MDLFLPIFRHLSNKEKSLYNQILTFNEGHMKVKNNNTENYLKGRNEERHSKCDNTSWSF